MNTIQGIIEAVKQLFIWWFIVEPWEQAVRVRFGKRYKRVLAGVHFKVPFFDIVYKQNTRRRISSIPVQTLTTADGKVVTVSGSLGYTVVDVLLLHQTLHDAEMTIKQEVAGIITDYIAINSVVECTPAKVTKHVRGKLQLERYGLGEPDFFLTGYVVGVRTYRLLQDTMQYQYGYGEQLDTRIPANAIGVTK